LYRDILKVMPNVFVTVFRSADTSAEEEATEIRDRLAQAGLPAILLGDDTPGVVEGTWEVRVAAADQAMAETIVAKPLPEPEDEVEVGGKGLSHDLDFVAVFSGQAPDAEMEALSIQSLLEASGIPSVVIGSQQIPSLPFEVRVPTSRLDEAKSLLEDARQSGAGSNG